MSLSDQLTNLRTAISNAMGVIDGKLRNKPDRDEIYTRTYIDSAGNTLGANAATATRLAATRQITLSGDGNGSVGFDGSSDVTLTLSVPGLSEKANAADTLTPTEIDNRLEALIGTAPQALDTLSELATALGDNPNFAATVNSELGKKASETRVDDLEQTLTSGLADLAQAFIDGTSQINSPTE